MDMLKTYFKVLYQEFKIVQEKHGFRKAALSTAFLTDVIPGIVMGMMFGQLQLMAIPLKWRGGEEYPDTLVEHVLIQTAESEVNWADVDERIKAKVFLQSCSHTYGCIYSPWTPGCGSWLFLHSSPLLKLSSRWLTYLTLASWKFQTTKRSKSRSRSRALDIRMCSRASLVLRLPFRTVCQRMELHEHL